MLPARLGWNVISTDNITWHILWREMGWGLVVGGGGMLLCSQQALFYLGFYLTILKETIVELVFLATRKLHVQFDEANKIKGLLEKKNTFHSRLLAKPEAAKMGKRLLAVHLSKTEVDAK